MKEEKKERITKTELAIGAKKASEPIAKHHISEPEKPHEKAEHKHTEQRPAATQHTTYAKKGLIHEYLQSWKSITQLKFIFVVGFDLLLYVLLYFLFLGFGSIISFFVEPFKSTGLNSFASQTAEQLAAYQQSLYSLIGVVFLLSIAFSILFVLIWSVSRGLIWAKLLDKRMTLRYFWKFFLLNLIWVLLWAVILIAAGMILYNTASANSPTALILGIIFVLLYLIMAYFMYILYYKFTEGDNRIFRSLKESFVICRTRFPKLWPFLLIIVISLYLNFWLLKETFVTGITRFTKLGLPFLLIIATIIIAAVFSLVFKLLPDIVMNILSTILVFAVFGWVKLYAAEALKERAR